MRKLNGYLRTLIRGWLGIERLNERLTDVEKHFVTRRDPASGQPVETLADRAAEQDGREKPKPIRPSRSWDQTRRMLEAEHGRPRKIEMPKYDA